jgi:hypothetical protein
MMVSENTDTGKRYLNRVALVLLDVSQVFDRMSGPLLFQLLWSYAIRDKLFLMLSRPETAGPRNL